MNTKVLKWILKNSKAVYVFIGLITIASVLLSLISLQFSMESKTIIDIATKASDESFVNSCLYIIVLLVLLLLVQIFINLMNVHASSRYEISMKNSIFKGLLKKEYLEILNYHSGELLNRINSDVSIIVGGVMTIVPRAALLITSVVGAFFYLYRIDRFLALIILAVGPFVLIGARIYSKKFKELHKKYQTADGNIKSFMLEILQNILVVKAFGNEDIMTKKGDSLQNISYKLRVTRAVVSIFAHIGMFLIFNAGFYFALCYCAYKLSQNIMTAGDLVAIIQLVNQIQSPFKNISGLVPQFFSVIASSERLMELENIKNEEDDGDEITDDILSNDFEIIFDDVRFSYNDDSCIMPLNIKIKKGDFCVIAGESGAGKSTAVKILLGILKPESGNLYIKTYKNEIKKIGKNTRKLFSYVPQGNLILSGTIRENVAFSKENVSDEQIINSLKVANLWDFITTLENGINTKIGENGVGLSEGQAQRISVARAILHNAPIVLLDEATSALDRKTEKGLLESISALGKTVIFVSHKDAAFDMCNKLIYMKKE